MVVLASVSDPEGRLVVLSEEGWTHITGVGRAAGHPELAAHLVAVTRATETPDRRVRGRRPDEEWFYLADVGPSRWLKVVVAYEGTRGRVITAFARRRFP